MDVRRLRGDNAILGKFLKFEGHKMQLGATNCANFQEFTEFKAFLRLKKVFSSFNSPPIF